MGYRNQQFYHLPLGTGTGSEGTQSYGTQLIPADNPAFPYPSRVIRTTDRDGKPVTTGMERGYIRSLASSLDGTVIPIKKCGFQFNPGAIRQVVNQPSSMLNFIQQDPGQYLQPMAGNVNFDFELFFDRSYELNNFNGEVIKESSLDNPWELLPPGQVGVLRDLAALYAVIGQGLSESQKDFVAQSLTQQIRRQGTADTSVSQPDVEAKVSSLSDFGGGTGFLAANVGNSAFLMPMPVRVVFSSLYIVEGLVQTSAVDFTMFSTAMVPMQCMVNLTLEAKYIGFAKKKTFFTVVLDEAKTQALSEGKTQQDQIGSVFGAIRAAGIALDVEAAPGTSGFVSSSSGAGQTGTFHDRPALLGGTPLNPPTVLLSQPSFHFVYARMPLSAAVLGTPIFDNIKKMFDDGIPMTIVDTAKIDVYGPFPTGTETGGPAVGSGTGPQSANWQSYLKSKATADTHLLTGTLGGASVSTGDEWVKLATGSMSSSPFSLVQGGTITDVQATQVVPYVVRFSGTVSVTTTVGKEPSTYSGEGEFWELVTDPTQYLMTRRVPMNWAHFGAQDDALGTITVDETGTWAASKPGDTSNVGSHVS